jgi:hypothetical protein
VAAGHLLGPFAVKTLLGPELEVLTRNGAGGPCRRGLVPVCVQPRCRKALWPSVVTCRGADGAVWLLKHQPSATGFVFQAHSFYFLNNHR